MLFFSKKWLLKKGSEGIAENKFVESGQELTTGCNHPAEKFGYWGQVFARCLWACCTCSFLVTSLFLFSIFLTG